MKVFFNSLRNLMRLAMFISSLLVCSGAMGQKAECVSKAKHEIALQFGVNQVKDKNLHPKVSTGTITELSYGFEKQRLTLQEFHFNAGYSRLKTDFEDLSTSVNLKLDLSHSQSYELIKKQNFRYYFGPEISAAYNVTYFPNWDDSHLYWADYLSIGPHSFTVYEFHNSNLWITTLSFPLFSVYSRPGLYRLYKIDDVSFGGIAGNLNSQIKAAHLVNVFFIRAQTAYRFRAFRNKQESFFYAFQYQRVKSDEENTFTQLAHQVGIRLFL